MVGLDGEVIHRARSMGREEEQAALAQLVVGDDQLGKRTAGGDPGERGADAARAYQENTHGPILDLSQSG